MEIDAWDHKGTHYSGDGRTLNHALRNARKQAMKEHGITWIDAMKRRRFPWPIVEHRACVPGAESVYHGEWRMDERRNM